VSIVFFNGSHLTRRQKWLRCEVVLLLICPITDFRCVHVAVNTS